MDRKLGWVALALLCGCATAPPPSSGLRYDITVEASADQDARKPRRVIIAPEGDPGEEFAYGALFAAGLLGSNGYRITGNLDQADLVVLLDLGISGPQGVIWEPPPGQRTVARRDELYARHLTITAYDWKAMQAGGDKRVVFRTSATSVGTTGEFRSVLPYLASAMEKHIGRNRDKPLELALSGEDERAVWLRDMVRKLTSAGSEKPSLN